MDSTMDECYAVMKLHHKLYKKVALDREFEETLFPVKPTKAKERGSNQPIWVSEAAFSQTPWRLKHIYSLSKPEKVNGLMNVRYFMQLYELWVKTLASAAAIILICML